LRKRGLAPTSLTTPWAKEIDVTEEHEHGAAKPPKKTIPHPDAVPAHKHDAVMGLVAEQFLHNHYSAKPGSVSVQDTDNPKEKIVTFVRVEHGDDEAAHHGIDLS
jgi:hypothetical protein